MSQYGRTRRRRRKNRTPGWVILVAGNAAVILVIMFLSLMSQIKTLEAEAAGDPYIGLYETSASFVSEMVPEVDAWESYEPKVSQDAEDQEVENLYPTFIYSKDWDGEDAYLLAKIAECEAGNQPVETRAKVILAVLNRVWSPQFPDSIEGVIMQHNNGVYQFSPTLPGGSWWYIEPSEESWEAVDLVMEMEFDTSEGALYFESFSTEEEMLNSWHHRCLEYLYQSGDMRFYK